MKKLNKDQVLQALAGLLPEADQKEVIAAVESFIEGVQSELEAEYTKKLDEAYKIIATEKKQVEEVAEQGYAEAYQIICELRDRLEVQLEEFKRGMDEGYEEAYQMILQERAKNDTLEMDLYEQYDAKVKEIRDFFVEKINEFLAEKGEEFYEQAKRDVIDDPTMAEHKVALDQILEVASRYMSEEDYHFATSSKLEEMNQKLTDLQGLYKISEAKSFRLGAENTRLNESLRQHAEMITEAARVEQKKEKQKKSMNVEGRGKRVVEQDRIEVINENTHETATRHDDNDSADIHEQVGADITSQWKRLAGVPNK